jgi:VCBS repeat-containing protein
MKNYCLMKNRFTSTITTLILTLLISACGSEDITTAANTSSDIVTDTNVGSDINTDTNVGSDINTDPVTNQVAMYSYNANLSDAQPLSDAVLEQTTVYMFFDNAPQYSSMNFYCCKGIDGASTGEAHKTPVLDSSAPFVYSVDLSQYSTAGTRELYVDRILTDGSGIDNIYINFSINISTTPIIPTPNTPAIISGFDRGSVTEDVDPDGDNLLEVGGKLNISDNDAGEAAFTARTVNGSYGSLTINTTGNWNYAANNTQTVIQNLDTGNSLSDTLTVRSVDGTTHSVRITINGADEVSTSADVSLSWVAPAEREDNTSISLSEIEGYKIYYGTNPGSYNDNVTINDGSATSYTFNSLSAGTYYFVVTTIDIDGRESQHSTVVTVTI